MKTLMFYGVRGSYPTVGREFLKYGGNTSSVMIDNEKQVIFLDAGTGIIKAGHRLIQESETTDIHIFLSHLHLDHIQGLPYFAPLFYQGYTITIYIPEHPSENSRQFLMSFVNPPVHPVKTSGLKAKLRIVELPGTGSTRSPFAGGPVVTYINDPSHPTLGVLIYILQDENNKVVYATDIHASEGLDPKKVPAAADCNILIHDAQYCEDQIGRHNPYVNLGHSSVKMALSSARRLSARKLYLFHYGPSYTDAMLDDVKHRIGQADNRFSLSLEGEEVNLRR